MATAAAGTKSVRCGWAWSTSQQVAETVVDAWRWSVGQQSAAWPRFTTEWSPITQVMRTKAGAAVPARSSSMASTERPWVRKGCMRRIAYKDTRGNARDSNPCPLW